MKAGWETKPLGEVCTLQRGFDLPVQDRKTGCFPLVSSSGISDTHTEGPVPGPGVVTGRSGSIGNVFYVEDAFWPLNTTLYVRDFHGNLPRLIYHLLVAFDLKKYAGGTGVPTLNRNDVHCVPVFVPRELSEQHRIVAILDEAFDGIATAKANAEMNLLNARELFDNALQSLLLQSDSNWVRYSMADVCDIPSKLVDPRKESFQDLSHVGAGNIEAKTGVLVNVLTARQEQLISGKFLFDESMVLYSKIRPYLMKVVRPDFAGLCSADIYPLSPKSGVITRDYLFYLLLSPEFTEYAIKGSARAGMPKVNREHLFAYELSLPSVQEQEHIAARLDTLAEETQRLISVIERKVAALDGLKKSLLHQAFAGLL